jgi:hypothetical protein
MITQQHLASINHADRDLYARLEGPEFHIVAVDISSGWEEYLEIFDGFYADRVEISDSTESGAVPSVKRPLVLSHPGKSSCRRS